MQYVAAVVAHGYSRTKNRATLDECLMLVTGYRD